jgi:hypothetical protein
LPGAASARLSIMHQWAHAHSALASPEPADYARKLMNELLERSEQKRKNADKPLPVVPTNRKLTKEQICEASDSVRANLTDALLKISAKLCSLPELGPQNLAQVAKLTDTAAKLFVWPSPKPIDSLAQGVAPTAAINLALIRTTPEQLRAKAQQTAISRLAS